MQTCRFGPLTVAYDDRVLEPRPWTYAQSTWAAEIAAQSAPGPLLELCAGAGHIGLAAAVLADRDLVQVEADPVAAEYARGNAARAGYAARVEVRAQRLEDAVGAHERFGVIVADPPYLPTGEVPRWPDDPVTAIDGGGDGLGVIRACLAVAGAHLSSDGRLVLQVAGVAQADTVAAMLARERTALQVLETRVHDEARAIMLIGRA
ncbi:methyltransferase [uncultured Jatrophihabitans sp.]|uniref:methyltransferase n=1 Tax=uncultured Jatrophihabitans sp. TaxID=1610747 RepID=UPI0035CB8506